MKLARKLPRFGTLISLEMLLSIGIVAIIIASVIPIYRVAVRKAQITELSQFFQGQRTNWMVDMALTGDGYLPSSTAPQMSTKPMPKIDGIEIQAKIEGNSIRYEGKLGEPFYVTLAPSIIAEGPIATVLWLCGNKKPPAGWTQPLNTGTNLPKEVLPFVCRV